MPLYINENELPTEDIDELNNSSILKKFREAFLNSLVNDFDLERLLYVGQREYAIVKSTDEYVDFIGSTDATTCHIVLLVDKDNKNCALCHFDGSSTTEGVKSMVETLENCENSSEKYDLYIVGGFNDSKKYSNKLTKELFNIFKQSNQSFFVKLWCVTTLNNTIKNNLNFPIVYGVCYNIKTQNIFICNEYSYKGPDLGIRGARHFGNNNGNMNIYDHEKCLLKIGPFSYEPLDYAKEVLEKADDRFLLKYFSTSPEQEPHDFCTNLRASFQASIDHPKPLETYFKNNQPKLYKRVKGQIEWQLIDSDN